MSFVRQYKFIMTSRMNLLEFAFYSNASVLLIARLGKYKNLLALVGEIRIKYPDAVTFSL